MAIYDVNVFCEFEVVVSIEADSEDSAIAMAEDQVATTFAVYNHPDKRAIAFDEIFGYLVSDEKDK